MNALQDFAVLGVFTSAFCALLCLVGWIAEKIADWRQS